MRNQPSSAAHRPDRSCPYSTATNPVTTMSQPSARPAAEASRVARSRSPVRCHKYARSSRPPSSGAAGSALKTASRTLIAASQANASTTSPDVWSASSPAATPASTPPATRLVRGPTPAMRSSAAGVGASSRRRAAPPSIHRVMPSTWTPLRRATTACASSCASSEARKTTAASRASAQYTTAGWPGWASGNRPRASATVTRATMTRTLQCRPTLTPAIRPRDSVSFMKISPHPPIRHQGGRR